MSLSHAKWEPTYALVVLRGKPAMRPPQNHRRMWLAMSAASASTTLSTEDATTVGVTGARLLRARERGAPVTVPGAVRADSAPAVVAVAAQQRFVAYAAHELRSEIALQRALTEVALADPNATTAALREMGKQVVVACERQERTLAAMLTLSRTQCGHLQREPVDLAATAADVLRAHQHHGLRSTTGLEGARTSGDPQLVERLVANLVANAIYHNISGGRLDTRTYTAAGRAIFAITNTGPQIPAGELSSLFKPFQRLRSHAGSDADGVGLGLAIVQAIATSHEAIVTATPRTGGGLGIEVAFPTLD
jgi:signal transduction histidine kinase